MKESFIALLLSVQHKRTSKAAGLEQKEGCKVEGEKGANSPACI